MPPGGAPRPTLGVGGARPRGGEKASPRPIGGGGRRSSSDVVHDFSSKRRLDILRKRTSLLHLILQKATVQMRGRERHLLCCSFSSVCCVRVFSSCAGLYVRALFVKKGICADPNLPLNRAIQLISSLRTACWSTQKRDFGILFSSGGSESLFFCLSEKKVVFLSVVQTKCPSVHFCLKSRLFPTEKRSFLSLFKEAKRRRTKRHQKKTSQKCCSAVANLMCPVLWRIDMREEPTW